MIVSALVDRIRKTRGPIFAEVVNFDDELWVKVVKSDLIHMIEYKWAHNEETGFTLDEHDRFGKDYGV